jgi:replication factor C subunit 3/5
LDWEKAIAKVAALIIAEQTPARLLQVRGHLYDIITKCIQPSVILKRLSFYLVDQVPEPVKIKIIEQAAFHVSQKIQL